MHPSQGVEGFGAKCSRWVRVRGVGEVIPGYSESKGDLSTKDVPRVMSKQISWGSLVKKAPG